MGFKGGHEKNMALKGGWGVRRTILGVKGGHQKIPSSFAVKASIIMQTQERSQDFSKGGSQRLYTAALPRVSAGSVVLSWHEGPY